MEELPELVVKKRGRYFRVRRIPVPTWRVCLPLLAAASAAVWFLLPGAYSRLAVSEPFPGADRIAVEGWLPDYALKQSASKIIEGHTARIYCTGGPLDRGSIVSDYGNYARYAAETLGRLGIPGEKIVAVPAPASRTGRTRSAASALRRSLDTETPATEVKRINLITLGAHARRSREIYQEELGSNWEVGVIAIPDEEVDVPRWFLQSKGVKDVLSEWIALAMGRLGAN